MLQRLTLADNSSLRVYACRLHTAVCHYNQVQETISDADKNLVLDLIKSAEEVNILFDEHFMRWTF